LLPLSEILKTYNTLRLAHADAALVPEALGPVRTQWFNTLWIPIASDRDERYYCLDLDPDAGGKARQVIRIQYSIGLVEVLDFSLADWLGEFANQLEGDVYRYSPETHGLVRANR
jgi:cell wall assembly regulator SMI1